VTPLLCLLTLLAADDDTDKRLEAGEVIITSEKVEGSSLPRVTALGVIEAPPEKVWALVEDCENYEKTMVRIADATELERDGGTVVCRVTADLPWPVPNLTSETRAVHTVEPGVKWERRWTMIKGDYRLNNGGWTLTPYKGDPKRTLAQYQLHIDPKIHVPDSFIASGQRKSLPDLFEKLRSQTVTKPAK
jgi:ribosome-associated toxin RatA of RatAB toxin-antitoxin module